MPSLFNMLRFRRPDACKLCGERREGLAQECACTRNFVRPAQPPRFENPPPVPVPARPSVDDRGDYPYLFGGMDGLLTDVLVSLRMGGADCKNPLSCGPLGCMVAKVWHAREWYHTRALAERR